MVKSYQIFLGLLFLFVVGTAVVSIINIKPKNPILTQQSEIIPIPVSELKEAITKSFEAGNPSFLKPYLTEVVALDILETEEDLEVADAILQLEDFFLIHPPQKFQIKHDGVSKSGKGSYLIGVYTDTLKKEYRVTIGTNEEHINNITIEMNRPLMWSNM